MSDKSDSAAAGIGYLVMILAALALIAAVTATGVIALYHGLAADVPWYIGVSVTVTGAYTLWSIGSALVRSFRKDKK